VEAGISPSSSSPVSLSATATARARESPGNGIHLRSENRRIWNATIDRLCSPTQKVLQKDRQLKKPYHYDMELSAHWAMLLDAQHLTLLGAENFAAI
jgi:hypothetical protein